MNTAAPIPSSREPRGYYAAAALLCVWTAAIALVIARFVKQFYPVGDQWTLLAHSSPPWAHPAEWFSEGFSRYFAEPEGLSQPYANFVRPVFNLVYWLLGSVLPPESGASLYFNAFVTAACAALVLLCLARARADGRPAAGDWLLAAAVPLLPALLPTLSLLLVPSMAFDPLAACWCLLAWLAYQRGILWLSTVWLVLAVFTKETALPVAATFPLAWLIENRRALRAEPRRVPTLLMLLVPVLLWLALRLAVFGELSSGGTYVASMQPGSRLDRLAQGFMHWPFWVQALPFREGAPLGHANLAGALMLAANAAIVAVVVAGVVLRGRRGRPPALEELCFLASYAFMLLVGIDPRLGAVLGVFLVLSLGRALREAEPVRGLRALFAAALAGGLALTAAIAVKNYPAFETALERYARISRRYVSALRTFPPGERVLVLNDPVSWHSPVETLARVSGVPAEVRKVADYACPGVVPPPSCQVSLAPDGDVLHYRFVESCGIVLCGAFTDIGKPASLRVGDIASAELLPSRESPVPAESGALLWRSYRLGLTRGGVHLLYFDPQTDDFRQTYVPAQSAGQNSG